MVSNLDSFKKWMEEKRLAPSTIATYVQVTQKFLGYMHKKRAHGISPLWIQRFNYDEIVHLKRSISYQNQCINGIKKYLEFLETPLTFDALKRPKKPKALPEIMSKEEVRLLLDVTINTKHKCLLSLLYSGGLRIGEALALLPTDIDSKRMLIHIKMAKGKVFQGKIQIFFILLI